MFHDLGLVTKFSLDHNTLCRWILTVKKNYRQEVPYHNWRHAFSVAQVMFSSLLQSGWWEPLGPVRCLGLLVACLSHDLDHRGWIKHTKHQVSWNFLGTNNTFQKATESPLSKLYSSSTLERHHLNQTLVILNLNGNTILEGLSTLHYADVISVIEEAILATDLSLHFKHLSRLISLSEEGPAGLDWDDEGTVPTHLSALMTASDLGASTKPWSYQKKVSHDTAVHSSLRWFLDSI